MTSDTILKIAALVAAIGAISIEDVEAVKQANILSEDVVANIENLVKQSDNIDDETIDLLNQARKDAGFPAV